MRTRTLLLLLALLTASIAVTTARARPASAAVDPPAPSAGYWLVASDGGIFGFGNAQFQGSTGDLKLNKPIVGAAPTPSGTGYWLVASDGGVFNFGDAGLPGSAGAMKLNKPIVGMAATPSGRGYWLVASDGGIFNFGDATFFGSTGALTLNKPIVGMASTRSGRGYWLVASDGGIFSFGDATFFGGTGSLTLKKPVVGMAPTEAGKGYWLVASDGGLFSFGDAPFFGSTGDLALKKPVVSMTPTRFGKGYWLVASDGGIFSFGDAPFKGSTGDQKLNAPIIGIAGTGRPAYAEVSAFYYPWYGNLAIDGTWRHWNDLGHSPPDDIASTYYPARGAYSSTSLDIVDAQMADMANAGIDTVVVSWWGPSSFEDARLAGVADRAHAHGLKVALHVEPYGGRTPAGVDNALAAMTSLGISDVYIYIVDLDGTPASTWRPLTDAHKEVRIFAKGGVPSSYRNGAFQTYAETGGFDGIYTYDPVSFAPDEFKNICTLARVRHLLCSPSVNPGYDGRRGVPDSNVRDRQSGALYDAFWQGAIASGADIVSITSYNEWHEGTQIEAAIPHCSSSPCSSDYTGAYGASPADTPNAYLARTRIWADRAHSAA